MKTQVVMSMEEYKDLPLKIAELIIAESKKDWGVKFIGREDEKEYPDDAMKGYLFIVLNKIFVKNP